MFVHLDERKLEKKVKEAATNCILDDAPPPQSSAPYLKNWVKQNFTKKHTSKSKDAIIYL